jgi:hypothetical protein
MITQESIRCKHSLLPTRDSLRRRGGDQGLVKSLLMLRWLGAGLGLAALVTTASGVGLGVSQMRSVWDRVYSDDQADRGETLYRSACEGCHAPDLSGGKVVPELVGATFKEDWDGSMLGLLFERVLRSMPEDDPASVTPGEKADILAYILRANGFPAGSRDLQAELDVLDRVRFDAVGP